MKIKLSIVACVILCTTCGATQSPISAESSVNEPTSTESDSASASNRGVSSEKDDAFVRAAKEASAVFEGTVVAVGPAPMGWSGLVEVYQTVTYRISRVVADRDKRLSVGATISVHHVIVAKSETADTKPQLRLDLVNVGSTVIVLADWRDDLWVGIDEHFGIVPADAAHRAALMTR